MPTIFSRINRARLLVASAAVLWSLGGLFTRVLQNHTLLDVNLPSLSPLQIAFYRALSAGIVFLPFLRSSHLTFRPQMLLMVAFFAAMNALFVSAMALGSAANAILLQNTAPFWVCLACILFLGESHNRENFEPF